MLTARVQLLALLVIGSLSLTAAAEPANFAGEWADKSFHGKGVFQLSLEQTGNAVSIFFSAAHSDGSGAAPEAEGKGTVSGGAVQFTWSDSFNNAGTGTVKKSGKDVIVSIKATKVEDSRCLEFYGANIHLKPAGKK